MDYRKELLLASAARLYIVGLDLEAARGRLNDLVARGVPSDAAEMERAYQDFTELERQWKALEQQHLELREELLRDGGENGPTS